MNGTVHDLILIFMIAAVTILLRALPFLLFPEGRRVPKLVTGLSNVLPTAVMGMLVVYCLRGVDVLAWPFGLPELCSVVVVVLCHIWKRNTLVSILVGTICYMLLVQVVF